MVGLIPPQRFAFYCDESGISNDRYTVVGGVVVTSKTLPTVLQNIAEFREKHNMKSELKWTKISNQKVEEYKALVEYFFAMNNTNRIHFHALIFDNHQWRHSLYNDGDPDIGISKLYYQLMVHKFGKFCAPHGDLFVCLDHRNSSTPHLLLQDMLNAQFAKTHPKLDKPFRQIISDDSKQNDLLQLNDVILGAVAAAKNGKHLLQSTRQAKRDIARLVLNKAGMTTYDTSTPPNVARFTVWNFRPR